MEKKYEIIRQKNGFYKLFVDGQLVAKNLTLTQASARVESSTEEDDDDC